MRIGLIGAGSFAFRGLLPAIASAEGISLVAVQSRTRANAVKAAERFGGTVCDTVDALLARADVDAVFVATPPEAHREIAGAILEAGKPLICEKPVALCARDAGALADLAARQGLLNAVNHEYRYDPAVRRMADLVRSGAVGRVHMSSLNAISTAANNPAFEAMRYWNFHHDRTRGGGLLPQFASHLIELHLAIFGGLEAVGAYTPALVSERPTRPAEPGGPPGPMRAVTAEDSAALTARLPGGGAATLAMTMVATSQPDLRWTIHGDKGSIIYEGSDGWFGGRLLHSEGWMGAPQEIALLLRRLETEAPGIEGWMMDLTAEMLRDFRDVLGGTTKTGWFSTLQDEATVWRLIEAWRGQSQSSIAHHDINHREETENA